MKVNSKHSKCVYTCEKTSIERKSQILIRAQFYIVRASPKTHIVKKKKEDEILANRTRKRRISINLNDDEKALFESEKEKSGAKSMAHFIRKTVLEKEIYEVDLSYLYEIQEYLKGMTDYYNQVAKQINQTGIFYKKDIDQMKAMMDELKKKVSDVHDILRK